MDIRLAASPADKQVVISIAHAANASALPLPFYQARRLASPLRRRAAWWLLREGGQDVAALLCYDLVFRRGEERAAGFGFGSVATVPEARRRGFASALCRAVAEDAIGRGRPLGLLFSAIPPALYERLGFVSLPCHDLCCDDVEALGASGPHAALGPIDPLDRLDLLGRLYDGARPGWRLERDEAGWRRSVADNASDVFFVIGRDEGYVRLVDGDGELEVVELVAASAAASQGAVRASASMAAGLGRTRLRGWLWPEQVPEGHFVELGRGKTLPMMSGLEGDGTGWFVASDYF